MPLARGFSRTSMQLRCFVMRLNSPKISCRNMSRMVCVDPVQLSSRTSFNRKFKFLDTKSAVFDALFSWGTINGKICCIQ